MTPLVSLESVSKARGSRQLFVNLSLSIFKGDHIGLIGANGSGKSTLLKIVAGIDLADDGNVSFQRGLRVGYVPQESTFPDESVRDVVARTLEEDKTLTGQDRDVRASVMLGKVGFQDLEQSARKLSGGWKKRLEIARQLVMEPDVLLLDEPTNHLDLDGVVWLEKFLERQAGTFAVVSHDRCFLENICNRMVELGSSYPKGLFCSEGSYGEFLERRDDFLRGQVEYEKSLASKVRREIAWLQRGAKARTTKSRSRQEAAHKLIEQHAEVRSRNMQTSAQLDFSSTLRETRKLLTATNIGKSVGGRSLFKGVNLVLSPGVRLGIVGANGTGKTTLLKILAGSIVPDNGTVKTAEGVSIVLFDQHREQLPEDISLRQALSPTSDRVHYRGQMIHVNSWCQRFLFSPERLELPISRLSGGEKARVLIARLMVQPADILLLDEPTNDLDIETLETLEESLLEFPGAVVLITHDRFLMERTCTGVLGLRGDGSATLLADYDQWVQLQKEQSKRLAGAEKKISEPKVESKKSVKLSFHEARELGQIQDKIVQIESKVDTLHKQVEALGSGTDQAKLQETCRLLHQAEEELAQLFERWQQLESKR